MLSPTVLDPAHCDVSATATRQRPRELAVFGGEPAFTETLHVGRPNVMNRDGFQRRLDDLLDRNWLTNKGPYVREFEEAIASYLGVKHCVAVCNATVGLELAARAIGLKGEVIVPSYTFVATAHALQWQEITPVFADISAESHTIDPACIERHITPRTTGILATHLWGRACDVDALQEIASRRGLALLFDAAHAFGCTYRGRRVGGFGAAEVFSFHATKFLNSFEGGAVTTNDDALAAKLRLMKNFGFSGFDNVIYVGTNGKMTEVCAAMGLSNLERLDDLLAVNRSNHEAYRRELKDLPGLRLLESPESEQSNHQYVVLEVDEERCALQRDHLIQILHAENVLARRYFWPGCHNMEPYRSYYPHSGLLLPVTNRVAAQVMVLPTGAAMDAHSIAKVCGIIRTAITRSDECLQAMNTTRFAA